MKISSSYLNRKGNVGYSSQDKSMVKILEGVTKYSVQNINYILTQRHKKP